MVVQRDLAHELQQRVPVPVSIIRRGDLVSQHSRSRLNLKEHSNPKTEGVDLHQRRTLHAHPIT